LTRTIAATVRIFTCISNCVAEMESRYHARISQLHEHLNPNNDLNRSDVFAQDTASLSASGGLLKGEVAIVTGSGQGIGEAAARLFASEGAKVVVTDLDAKKSTAVAEDIKKNGGTAISIPGDITDPAFPDRLIKETIAAFGKLNVLVNNAGYTFDGVIHKMSDKQWDAMLVVHNTAPFRLIRAAAPYLRDAGKQEIDAGKIPENRVIINVSSTSGLHGNFGQANYATAKAGIIGLTKTVAKEWGPFGVRANTIAFGWIDTRLTRSKDTGAFIEVEGKKVALGIPGADDQRSYDHIPLKRPGKVDDAAKGLLFLASHLSSYVSGHTLELTGGVGI